MKLKALLARWFAPPATKEAIIRRYRAIAARETAAAVVMLVVYFTVPAWATAAHIAELSALFLGAAGLFAALAGVTLWTAALLKRDSYF